MYPNLGVKSVKEQEGNNSEDVTVLDGPIIKEEEIIRESYNSAVEQKDVVEEELPDYDNLFPTNTNQQATVEKEQKNDEYPQVEVTREEELPVINTSVSSIDPITKDYTDEHGEEAQVTIESTNSYNPNLIKGENYKLSEAMKPSKNPLVRRRIRNNGLRGVFGDDIGFKSNGFAGIAGLSSLVAFATLLILYLLFRF